MAKDTEKLIRQLSLISYLMAERRPVTATEIRRDVEGYSGMNEDAFARRFYADRAELDSLGIALSVDKPADGAAEQENYSLRPEQFYLPDIKFSDSELAALFAQTDRCHYDSQVPLRHLVMPVLFRTIYACGLRASEARLLRVDDVDLAVGVLRIRDAKGGKDRQVPVSEPLRARLAGYHARVAGHRTGDWFFPGRVGQPLTLGNVEKNFRRFLWQARISHGGRGHGPRVHDLRHTFVVNNLRLWFARGEDVGALLPVLQTYLGHSSIADTAYYLRLTAESHPDITGRVQQVLGDVVPPLTTDITGGPRDGD